MKLSRQFSRKHLRRNLALCSIASIALLLCGCAPRGETNSLDEVLRQAKQRYESAPRKDMPAEVEKSLNDMTGALAKMTSGAESNIGGGSKEVAALLDSLTPHAGITSRPALTELSNQYRSLSSSHSGNRKNQAAAVKLLVSRTYSLLASELEGVRFKL